MKVAGAALWQAGEAAERDGRFLGGTALKPRYVAFTVTAKDGSRFAGRIESISGAEITHIVLASRPG